MIGGLKFRVQGSEYGGRGTKEEGRLLFVHRLSSCVLRILILSSVFCLLSYACFAQDSDLEFTLDINSPTIPLPNIFKPNMDLSGRGFSDKANWPRSMSAQEVLNSWQKDIGFDGIYRMQFNLWDIVQAARDKDKNSQNELLAYYERIIKQISQEGGIVLLDIFGTPPGLGKVLDKTSVPQDLKAFKALIKGYMRDLSCVKRYNIWYEAWSAPDMDDFFLGRKQEYLNVYKCVAEAAKDLENETKIYIPVGGPGTSWWFKGLDGNTIITPEKSLIYELIRFCARYNLPLDFISWHAYSSDPKVEKETTIYKKTATSLVRDWLSYFRFNKDIPLIVSEWNYDSTANILPERRQKSFISASYIPSRIKNMYEAKLDYQIYFCLEDFQSPKDGVARNVGLFWFDALSSQYKGGHKAAYNTFRMLSGLGNNMFLSPFKFGDEFVGAIATKKKNDDQIAILIYNYIDPEIAMNFLSKNISTLKEGERRILLNLSKTDKLKKIITRELDTSKIRLTARLRNLIKKCQELNAQAVSFKEKDRSVKITLKNLPFLNDHAGGQNAADSNSAQQVYFYQRYSIDPSCGMDCEFAPAQEKDLDAGSNTYQEALTLKPYSVNMVILTKKIKEPPAPVAQPEAEISSVDASLTKETLPDSQNTKHDLDVSESLKDQQKAGPQPVEKENVSQ